MLEVAVAGAAQAVKTHGVRYPAVLGVTVLTSIGKDEMNQQLRVPGSVRSQVRHLAAVSTRSGLDGIVCSAHEISAMRQHLPQGFLYVTPGIVMEKEAVPAGQARVATAGEAVKAGSSLVVAGRAVTGKCSREERQETAYKMLRDMAAYL